MKGEPILGRTLTITSVPRRHTKLMSELTPHSKLAISPGFVTTTLPEAESAASTDNRGPHSLQTLH